MAPVEVPFVESFGSSVTLQGSTVVTGALLVLPWYRRSLNPQRVETQKHNWRLSKRRIWDIGDPDFSLRSTLSRPNPEMFYW